MRDVSNSGHVTLKTRKCQPGRRSTLWRSPVRECCPWIPEGWCWASWLRGQTHGPGGAGHHVQRVQQSPPQKPSPRKNRRKCKSWTSDQLDLSNILTGNLVTYETKVIFYLQVVHQSHPLGIVLGSRVLGVILKGANLSMRGKRTRVRTWVNWHRYLMRWDMNIQTFGENKTEWKGGGRKGLLGGRGTERR